MEKVLICADAVIETGFGRVTNSLVSRLKGKFDISILAVNYWGDPHDMGVRIYPARIASQVSDVYGFDRLSKICAKENPRIIFIINDIWIIDNYLTVLKNIYTEATMPKIVVYFPIDAKDHMSRWYEKLEIVSRAVVYNQFGLEVASKAREFDYKIIGHGVDSDIFSPIENAKFLVYPDLPEYQDSFIVLNANRNQPRKRLELTIKGFALFAEGKPENVKLHLHSGYVDSHVNTAELMERYGIKRRLILTSTNPGQQNVPVSVLNQIYNAADIGINTSLGEGFGLCSVEHARLGKAQIVPGSSACVELFYDCGLLLNEGIDFTQGDIQTTGFLVSPDDVANKLEVLYKNAPLRKSLEIRSAEKFKGNEFSWDYIAQQWESLFNELL